MPALRIVALCTVAAILYGVGHDLVTAHVCVEYFTVGHPPVFGTDDPVVLALGWGVLATWWVGLGLGAVAAAASRAGSRPKRSATSLVRPVAGLMLFCAACAAVAGVAGWLAASAGAVWLVGPMAEEVPAGRHARFLADLWAHLASYAAGALGGLVLAARVWRGRADRAKAR